MAAITFTEAVSTGHFTKDAALQSPDLLVPPGCESHMERSRSPLGGVTDANLLAIPAKLKVTMKALLALLLSLVYLSPPHGETDGL